jgi:hypothetical protein
MGVEEGLADLIPDMSDVDYGCIYRQYPHIGTWELGHQLVCGGEEVYMRKYCIPHLNEAEDSEVDEVEVPHLGRVYRVSTLVPVTTLCGYAPFNRWTRSRDYVRVQEYRSTGQSSTLTTYRPTLEELEDNPDIEDKGPFVTFNTGEAVAWGNSKEYLLEPSLTLPIKRGERLTVALYGEEVLEVVHTPGPRGADEDDDVLVSGASGIPPGYNLPVDFPNNPGREKRVMSSYYGRARG